MHALTLQLANALRELLAPSHVIADTSGNSRTLKMVEADGRAALAAFDQQQAAAAELGEYNEPWIVEPSGSISCMPILERRYREAVAQCTPGMYRPVEMRRRIGACVNACAGIPTELLESLELGELDAAVNDGARDPSHPMLGR